MYIKYVIAFKDNCIMEIWTEGVFRPDIKLTGTDKVLSLLL